MAAGDSEEIEQLRRLVESEPEDERRAEALTRLALELRRAGHRSEALALAEEATERFRGVRASGSEAELLFLTGCLLADLHRDGDAARRLAEARHSLELTDAPPSVITRCERLLADLARRRGRPHEAERWLGSARDRYAGAGSVRLAAGCDHDLGVLRHGLGDLSGAVAALRAARSALLGARDREGVASCGFNLGIALHDAGAHDEAIEQYQQARSIFAALGRLEDAAGCDQNIAAVLFGLGRTAEAGQRLEAAQATYRALRLRRRVAECDADLAQVARRSGHGELAIEHLARARAAGVEDPADATFASA